jgi:hypothetical protein
MNQQLALRVLDDIMKWDEQRRIREFNWLELMSRFKFDAYHDFGAGMRFLERLADWLQQFSQADRNIAYDFVKDKLIYLGSGEINHLVELFYYQEVQPFLQLETARRLGIQSYLVWSQKQSISEYETLLRKCLFFGLSDGARVDTFRRVNTPLIKNDQVLLATEISDEKWEDLRKSLRSDLKDQHATFKYIFLLDDFVGTGSTLIRHEAGQWKGRLLRFWNSLPDIERWQPAQNGGNWKRHMLKFWNSLPGNKNSRDPLEEFLAGDFQVRVHHYVATTEATTRVDEREEEIRSARSVWFPSVTFTFGTVLPSAIKLSPENSGDFGQIIGKHYNKKIETKSTKVGGTDDIKYGYGYCGLPLVLEHNTPNNSLPILWADLEEHPEMRPLFRRRQRYSE